MTAQKTLAGPVRIEGRGLHLGEGVRIELVPAPQDTGVVFVRTDLPGNPRVQAGLENLVERPRRTALAQGAAEVHTVEHLMASLWALGIQNVEVRMDGPEVPGLDGSALPFYEALKGTGVTEQDAPRRDLEVEEPVSVTSRGANIVAIQEPSCLRISYTLDYDSPVLSTQYLCVELDEETFAREIAPARTFVFEEEVRKLQMAGLGKGADTRNTLVLARDGTLIDNEFRFENEFVRHKILDLIGDLYLTSSHISAHVLATKSGHALNVELARSILGKNGRRTRRSAGGPVSGRKPGGALEIAEIEGILPHRYPFLFVDRVLEISEDGGHARGLKNITANEEYFAGHFPGNPVMPGVLQIEAMAQLAGLMLRSLKGHANDMAYLLRVDKVKFRRPVVPGDQLLLEAQLRSLKTRTAVVDACASVGGAPAAEASIQFMLVPED